MYGRLLLYAVGCLDLFFVVTGGYLVGHRVRKIGYILTGDNYTIGDVQYGINSSTIKEIHPSKSQFGHQHDHAYKVEYWPVCTFRPTSSRLGVVRLGNLTQSLWKVLSAMGIFDKLCRFSTVDGTWYSVSRQACKQLYIAACTCFYLFGRHLITYCDIFVCHMMRYNHSIISILV